MISRPTVVLALAMLLTASGAAAQEGTRIVDRPLTLPARTVSADVTLGYQHDERFVLRIPGDTVEVDPEGTVFALLGARVALGDDVELSALVLPIRIAPDAHYGFPLLTRDVDYRDPWAAATWRFFASPSTDLGARARVYVPQHQETRGDLRVDLEALAAVRARDFRFEPSLLVGLRAGTARTIDVAAVPLTFTYQPADLFWLRLRTGVYAYADFTEIGIPGGLAAGTTFTRGAAPAADVWLEAEAPHLLRPTANDPTDVDVLTLTANTSIFF